jgi:transposase
MIPVGIDVGARQLVVAWRDGKSVHRRTFPNDPGGHARLAAWLPKKPIRVAVEATGFYSLDVCIALHARGDVEVMVANPRAVASFAKAMMTRGKTDEVDAEVLLEFAERMPFTRWIPPAKAAMELRATTRRVRALVKTQTVEKNRLRSAQATNETPDAVLQDIEDDIAQLDGRIKKLTKSAIAMAKADPILARKFELLQTIPGIAENSAIRLLGELVMLPADMNVKEWVAHAGLDPRSWKSGTSIELAPRVTKAGNKYIRNALFLPALVGIRHDPHVKAFYDRLIRAGKRPLQATVAVMRKLLHAIYGMLKSDQPFDGNRFCPDFVDAKPKTESGDAERPSQEPEPDASDATAPTRPKGSARRTVAVERGATGSSPHTG